MGAGVVQVVVGIVIGIAILVAGAAFVARAEGAVRAVAALGCAALGLMLLADILVAAGLSLPPSRSYAPVGMLVGGVSLALLALPLMLMGDLTGVVWAVRRHRFADLGVLGMALVSLVAAGVLAIVTAAGIVPATGVAQRNTMLAATFGLGTLAAALIAFWAVPVARQQARSRRVAARGTPA
ncbi:MAG TPA: hypothetical protein VJQ45_01385 [Ktedonobacterales bacterium]|nr:hypothetical protein [Ktedonobacterales bacterium]